MALDLPRGHFDTTGAQDLLPPPKTARVLPFPDPPEIAAPTIAALLARFRDELEELPDPLRKAVADLVSDYLKTPDPETGQTVASAIERLIDRKTPP